MSRSDIENLNASGQPDPLDFRRQRALTGNFAPGRALSNTDPTTLVTPIAGALLVRLRGKIATTEDPAPSPLGVLSFAYRRPVPYADESYDSTLSPPAADVTVTADTEFLVDIEPGGEGNLGITFTPDAGVSALETISVTFLDIMQQ